MPALYFLAGLGIIMAIIGINWIYDQRKAHTAKEEGKPYAEAGEEIPQSEIYRLVVGKIRAGENIFGLPLTYCDDNGTGSFITMDREDNLYVVETDVRDPYTEMYDQVKDDLYIQKRRIQKSKTRKVYAIVCQAQPSEMVLAAAQQNPSIRVFKCDLEEGRFTNIY